MPRFNRQAERKKVFKKSLGMRRNSLGLFGYTPHSPGDDSLFRKRIRKLFYIIITILAKRDEGGQVIIKPK